MKKPYALIIVIFVASVVLLGGCGSTNKSSSGQEKQNYVPVETVAVRKMDLSREVILSGKVFPFKDIMVMPKMVGKVINIEVEVGERVNKEDLLFSLDREDIEKQLENARVSLDGARANYSVTEEQVLNAKANLERMQELYSIGAISKSQLEQAQLAASDRSLEAASAMLSQAEVAYTQALEAVENTYVTSPINGVVAAVNVDEGEYATTAQPALLIVDMDIVYVRLDLTEDIVSKLEVGDAVEVTLPAVSQETITAHIDNISPVADAKTQLYPVKIFLSNEELAIKAGFFSKVKLSVDRKEDAIAVPSEAVVERNGIKVVYVAIDNVANERKVTTGLDTGTYTQITEGISSGEFVIIKGQHYVDDGTAVKITRGDGK